MSRRVKNTSVLYVNFAPYENAGFILDYLRETFASVYLITLNFHQLSPTAHSNKIEIYTNGGLSEKHAIYEIPVPQRWAFVLLPIRSVFILVELIWVAVWLKRKFGKPEVYFTVNAYLAWIGTMLKRMALVGTTVFWIWDYYPPVHKRLSVSLMRWFYWYFDTSATKNSDRLHFMNARLAALRKDMGILPDDTKINVIPVGTKKFRPGLPESDTIHAAFLGVIKESQGIELLAEIGNRLRSNGHRYRFHIIGTGPDMERLRQTLSSADISATYYGYVPDADIFPILRRCHIGLAPYLQSADNVSQYSDPSKIKWYLSAGLPVITTDVFSFAGTIAKKRAGKVVPYDAEAFAASATAIRKQYARYRRNALVVRNEFDYRNVYRTMFPV